MSNFDDEDLEIEAIAKCAKALSRLDNESKTRVIRYLLDKPVGGIKQVHT